jgi:cathepsin B
MPPTTIRIVVTLEPTAKARALTTGYCTVSLNWTAPASDGGSPITSYTVYYSSVNGNFTTLTEATSITLTGLASSATYTVSVSASNSAGTSSPSLSVTFETPDSFSRRSSCNNVSCLPPTFDFRASYPQCATPIMNQGRCGSCYAFATAAASTDRYCRQVQQILPQVLSPQDILNCGKDIAWRNEKGKDACGGGSIYGSAIVVGTHGLEKASNAALKSGCRPYTVECFYGGVNKSQPYCGGKCSATCDNGAAYLPTKSQLFLDLTYLTPDEIRLEIHQNGPIAADFGVCRNFQMSSRSFNWQQVWTSECDIYLGGHSIVITGWGTLNGIDYWLIANSWGAETQDKGYFRLLRNVNFLEIERRQLVAIQFRSNGDKRNIQVSRQINTNTTDDLVGGIVAGNTSSSEAQEAAQFALDNWFNEGNSTYNETSAVGGLVTNTNPFHVTNITSISYQVVAGTLVYVSFEATNGTEVLQLEATITYDPYHVPIAIELTAGNSAGRFTSALMTILWFLLSIF